MNATYFDQNTERQEKEGQLSGEVTDGKEVALTGGGGKSGIQRQQQQDRVCGHKFTTDTGLPAGARCSDAARPGIECPILIVCIHGFPFAGILVSGSRLAGRELLDLGPQCLPPQSSFLLRVNTVPLFHFPRSHYCTANLFKCFLFKRPDSSLDLKFSKDVLQKAT